MKLLPATLVAFGIGSCTSFTAPSSKRAFVSHRSNVVTKMAEEDQIPFFASGDDDTTSSEELSLEEEVKQMAEDQAKKMRRVSNLRNEKGVEFAPWMNISPEDEARNLAMVREKAEARRKRQEEERNVSGNLYRDSQSQELSGAGLNYKIVGENDVELEWATKTETNTKGFVVKKRASKTKDFSVLASYEEWGPLQSKGMDGGVYRYVDTEVSPGGYVYRITECDNNGVEADLCQCLVEVETKEEQRGALIAAVGIVGLLGAAVVAGLLLDPTGGY